MIWDNSNCVFAVLPSCLKLGSNPPDGYYTPAGKRYFPIYRGPSCSTPLLADMYPNGTSYPKVIYENGLLDFRNTPNAHYGNMASVFVNYERNITTSEVHSVEVWGTITFRTATIFPQCIASIYSWNRHLNNNQNLGGSWAFNTPYAAGTYKFPYLHTVVFNHTTPPSWVIWQVGHMHPSTTLDTYTFDYFEYSKLHHYACTKNGTDIKFYVDGILQQGTFNCWKDDQPYDANDYTWNLYRSYTPGINIGGYYVSSNTNNFNRGKYYSWIVYDTALTPERIATNYQLGPTLGKLHGYINDDNTIRLIRELSDSEKPTNSFTSIGMPQATFNSPSIVSRDTQLSNPKGSVVDNSEGDRSVSDRPLGTSSGSGASLESYSKPSWLY